MPTHCVADCYEAKHHTEGETLRKYKKNYYGVLQQFIKDITEFYYKYNGVVLYMMKWIDPHHMLNFV